MRITLIDSQFGMASNCYLVESGKEYIIVDPSADIGEIYNRRIDLQGTKPKLVLLTHVHYDHIKCIDSYARAGVKIYVSHNEGKYLSDSHYNCARFLGAGDYSYSGEYEELCEGDKISFGDTTLTVLETPGHSLGSLCYLGDGVMFTGDTLFERGGYGRYDLPGGDVVALEASLRRLLDMPKETVIYPGHCGSSTIGQTKKYF